MDSAVLQTALVKYLEECVIQVVIGTVLLLLNFMVCFLIKNSI